MTFQSFINPFQPIYFILFFLKNFERTGGILFAIEYSQAKALINITDWQSFRLILFK